MTDAQKAADRGAVVTYRVGEYMVRILRQPTGYTWTATGDYGDMLTGRRTFAEYEDAAKDAALGVGRVLLAR